MSAFCLFDLGSTHGPFLQRCINTNKDADRYFAELIAMMRQMLDGDGSQDQHYATIQVRFGFESVTTAHAAFLELDSAYGKTSGDDAVDHVRAARDQLFARLTV